MGQFKEKGWEIIDAQKYHLNGHQHKNTNFKNSS